MGKLGGAMLEVWRFLDGWKSWLVACVAVWKLACHDCASAGYLTSICGALGWDPATGAFDPKEALAAALVMIALGHRLAKAIAQYRAGRPVDELLSEAPPPPAAAPPRAA